jgi:hypothetical protein
MTRAQIAERAKLRKAAKVAERAQRDADNERRRIESDEMLWRVIGERLERERATRTPPDTRTELQKRFGAIGEEIKLGANHRGRKS